MTGDEPTRRDEPRPARPQPEDFGAHADESPFGFPLGSDDADDIPFADPVPSEIDEADDWDAHDERRQKDQMAPPSESCECYCLHCGRVFMSDLMWFQKVVGDKRGFDGFWRCPTPNCSGAGFTFDIFPTDPSHPANAGWVDDEYDEDEESDVEIVDEDYEPDELTGDWSIDEDAALPGTETEIDAEYDPDEPKYKALDEQWGDGMDPDDLEGEEWKYGLEPGQRPPPQMFWPEDARREWEDEQQKYDLPDERPRELDWSNRDDRDDGPTFRDDDIPF